MCNSCSLTAWQRGLATRAAWQRGFTTVCCLLGRVNNCRHQLAHIFYHSKGLDQRSGSTPLERSGSGVWIRGLDRLWDRGLIQTLHFESEGMEKICYHFGQLKQARHAADLWYLVIRHQTQRDENGGGVVFHSISMRLAKLLSMFLVFKDAQLTAWPSWSAWAVAAHILALASCENIQGKQKNNAVFQTLN